MPAKALASMERSSADDSRVCLQGLAGVRAVAGLHPGVPVLDRARASGCRDPEDHHALAAWLLAAGDIAAGAGILSSEFWRLAARGRAQHRVRLPARMGAGALPFPRKA